MQIKYNTQYSKTIIFNDFVNMIISNVFSVTREWKLAWDSFTQSLEFGGIHLHSWPNSLMWAYNKLDGSASAKLFYESIVSNYSPATCSRLLKHIWSGTLPKKNNFFIWLALMNKLLTWDNLQKRGWTGPGICALYAVRMLIVYNIFFFIALFG